MTSRYLIQCGFGGPNKRVGLIKEDGRGIGGIVAKEVEKRRREEKRAEGRRGRVPEINKMFLPEPAAIFTIGPSSPPVGKLSGSRARTLLM